VPIVGRQPTSDLPNPLDWVEFWTVWRQEHEREYLAVRVQPWLEHSGVVVLGVVQYQDKALATGTVFEQAHQETLEGLPIEYRFEGGDQFLCGGLPRRSMPLTCAWAHAEEWGLCLLAAPTYGSGCRVAGSGIRRNSIGQPLDRRPDAAVFLKAACASGSALAMTGRGLRSRKPIWPNSRWHWRVPSAT
jgi:hypothetical protein